MMMGTRQCHNLRLHSAKPLLTKQDNAPQRECPLVQQCQLNRLHVTALWVEAKDPTTFSSSSLSGLIFQPINPQAGLLCGAEAAVLIMLKCACVIRLGGGQESCNAVFRVLAPLILACALPAGLRSTKAKRHQLLCMCIAYIVLGFHLAAVF